MAQRRNLSFLFLIFLIGSVSAGTVSITGTCQSNLLAGNILNFTLVNTGNETAYSAILTPFLSGAQPQNQTYPIGSLSPDIYVPILIPLYNITTPGAYTDSFVLTYQQGTSSFTALFPCLINIGKPTTSGIYLTVNTTSGKGNAVLNVSVFNGVRSNFTVNISALFPPSFQFLSSPSYILNLGPYQTKIVSFLLEYPTSQGSYTGAVAEKYVSGNLSYSSFAAITILSNPPQTSSPINWIFLAGGAFFIIIILLIIRSALKKKKPAVN